MQTIIAKTYSGSVVTLNKKAYRKAVKCCSMLGLKNPNVSEPTQEQVVKYLRAKSASFQHALHTANLYSMRIRDRNAFVI